MQQQMSSAAQSLRVRLLACVALSLALLAAARAFAFKDTSVDWRLLETAHFTIVYDSKQQELANAYARYAEQAWAADAPVFGEWPDKTVLILNDRSDLANGAAMGIPYPMIEAFPVLPAELDSIADYGDWGLELMTHEYAHILTFEPAHGWVAPVRAIFGTVARPNMLLPRWYMEGLAVQMETRFSRYGRLRSPNFLAIPRAMAREGGLRKEDIGRVNEVSIADWPGGARPYLMGALMWNEMVRAKGDAVIGDLNQRYSRRIPFFIGGPAEDVFGVGYEEILERAYARADALARKQIETIAAAGATPATPLDQPGFFSYGPAISPDGDKMVYVAKTHNRDNLLMLVERPKGSTEPFSKFTAQTLDQYGNGVQRVSWLPDSKSFVYDSIASHQRYQPRSDLFRFDLEKKQAKPITKSLRAREPAVSPDGKTIAFVQLDGGRTRLAIVPIDSEKNEGYRAIYAPRFGVRISRPEFISNDEIVFTEKSDDGASQGVEMMRLVQLTPEVLAAAPRSNDEAQRAQTAGSVSVRPPMREILSAFRPAHFPRKTPDGLAFVSDRSGVANVYLANADMSSARAITNVETRAITPEIDPRTHDLYFSLLRAAGPRLARTEAHVWLTANVAPPKVGSMVDYEWPRYDPPAIDAHAADGGEYAPWRWLYPRNWIPLAYYLPGFFLAQASTSANDPLGHHAYSLGGGYDSLTQRPNWFVNYRNEATAVPFGVSAADYYEYIYTGGFNRHETIGLAAADFYLPWLNAAWLGSAGWSYRQTELGSSTIVRDGPTVAIRYSDVNQQRGDEISPESGGAVELRETHYLPARDDNEYEVHDFKGSYYFSKGLPERHALALFANASIAPRMGSAFLGRTTIGGNFATPSSQMAYMMRGYPWGEFFGRNIANGTIEYRFPISYENLGYGTRPFFLRRWHGAVFMDGVTLDGAYYDFTTLRYEAAKMGTFYLSAGAEARADVTAFYYLPLTLIIGAYAPFEARARSWDIVPFFGIGM